MRLRTHWPELCAIALLLILVQHFFSQILRENGGTFTYCLDDAYIHMAVAKNIVLHHVLGATQYETSSPSSSPLWTLLLAADFLLQGVNEGAPIVLNLVSAIAALIVAAHCWRRVGCPQPVSFLLLAAIILAVPLPTVIFDGMEHALHLLLVFAWVALLIGPLQTDAPVARERIGALTVLAALMTACRYESLLLILMTCVLLAARRQWSGAVAIGLGALSLISLYGLYALSHGLHFLPDSLLMKAPQRDLHSLQGILLSLGGAVLKKLAYYTYLAAMLLSSVALLWWLWRQDRGSWKKTPGAVLALFASTLLLHLEFARTGWFFRYEAYLIGFGLLALGTALPSFVNAGLPVLRRVALAMGVLAVVGTFAPRTARALRETPEAPKNIHDQQLQMASFVSASGVQTVAVFDLGFVAYLSDVHVLDLGGLGSPSVANEILRSGRLSRRSIDALTREAGVELVMLHTNEWEGMIPKSWRLIGQWKAPLPNVILGSDVLSFFATEKGDAPELKRRLAAFSATQLPKDVAVWIPQDNVTDTAKVQ